MKRVYLSLVFLTLTFTLFAQNTSNDTLRDKVEKEAKSMTIAIITKDYESYIKYMHPILINAFGGSDKVLEKLKQGILNSATIEKIEITNMSNPIIRNENIQCTMNQIATTEYPNGKFRVSSTLIGVSNNNGKTWTFIDAGENSLSELQSHFPELNDNLKIIPMSEPEFIKD